RPGHRARGGERFGRTLVGDPVAGLSDVTRSGRGTTHRSRVARRVLACGARAVTLVDRAGVAVVRARGCGGLGGVGRAARAAAGAELGDVTLACGGAALGRDRREGVDRAGDACPVTGLGRVARTSRGPAHRALRSPRVDRAVRAGAGAGLGRIADSGRRSADRAGVPRRVLALHAEAVADVGGAWVGVVRAGGAGGLVSVRRALRAVAGAGLRDVALARCRATHGARGSEPVGGTAVGRAVARFRDVTGSRRRTADAAGGLLGVGRTGRARARTGLGYVAHPAGGAAGRPGGGEGTARRR